MSKKRTNKFTKAIGQLKSTTIDERLEVLSEIPTNSTMGVYTIDGGSTTEPEVTGGPLPANFEQDDSATDTTGLFDAEGNILLEGPPITAESPDDSYILGPMASMWYAWGNFTQIGYIRQSDRKMVNLARITGELQDWDKVSNFTSYGQLTLEQAVWFCNAPKYENGYANYRAFYPGPPSNEPDEFGRYYCTIVGTPKTTRNDPFPTVTPPTQGNPQDAGVPFFGSNPTRRRPQPGDPDYLGPEDLGDAPVPLDPYGDIATLAISYGLASLLMQGLAGLAAQGGAAIPMITRTLRTMTKGKPTYRPTQATYGGSPKPPSTPRYNPRKPGGGDDWQRAARNFQRQNPGSYNPFRSDAANRTMKQMGVGSKPNPNPNFRKPLSQSYEPTGDYIQESLSELPVDIIPVLHSVLDQMGGPTPENINKLIDVIKKYSRNNFGIDVKESVDFKERRKKILREVKQPYVLREVKKEKYKFKKADKVRAKLGRTINPDMMKQAECPTSFKQPEDRMWGKYEKERNAKASQDKKNVVLDHLGGTDHVLEYILETGREKGNKIVYGNFGSKAPKKVVRKEQLKGDNLLFIADENGKKETILQSEINDKLDEKHTKELFAMYQEPTKPLFEKLREKL
tara:strand:- start:570 stop:2447 length:1878 start_codon:yes stop_codon:yes gene_type:complete